MKINKEELKELLNDIKVFELFEELANERELEHLPTAHLVDVDLSYANLENADMSRANLYNADMNKAKINLDNLDIDSLTDYY